MRGRHPDHRLIAEPVEIPHRRFPPRVIHFVHHHDNTVAGSAQPVGQPLVLGSDAFDRHHQHDCDGVIRGGQGALGNDRPEFARIVAYAASVQQAQRHAGEHELLFHDVTGDARHGSGDGPAAREQPIEQGGLADVRSAHDSDERWVAVGCHGDAGQPTTDCPSWSTE